MNILCKIRRPWPANWSRLQPGGAAALENSTQSLHRSEAALPPRCNGASGQRTPSTETPSEAGAAEQEASGPGGGHSAAPDTAPGIVCRALLRCLLWRVASPGGLSVLQTTPAGRHGGNGLDERAIQPSAIHRSRPTNGGTATSSIMTLSRHSGAFVTGGV